MTSLLDADQVADIVGLSPFTIRRALRSGELAGSKIRGRWRTTPAAVAAWIDACRHLPATPAAVPGPRPRAHRPVPAGGFRQLARAERREAS